MDVERALDELRFNVARSVRYHDKRRAFYESMGKGLQLVSLLGSSAAVIALLKDLNTDSAALVFSAVAASTGLLNLVIGTSGKLEVYTKLKNRFLDLQARVEAVQEPTEAVLSKLIEDRYQIEKEEPGISVWINKICYNETIDALGYDASEKRPVPWYYHLGHLKLT